LFFAIAFLLGYNIMERIFKVEKIPMPWLEKLFIYVIVGTVLGARLGHVFFYDWDYYSQNLGEILMVWHGGLASHGGAIGIVIAILLFSKKISKKSPIWILDRLVIPTALAAFFIRMGNLMNSEIYGHQTSLPWGFVFALNGEEVPKHPTQIYEALSYLSIFGVLMWMYWKTLAKESKGLLFGIFLVGTFSARFLIEFVKENQSRFEADMVINMGQWLSIPFVLAGVYFILNSLRKKAKLQKA
jgi:prolipoprotein diacylglyceryl transferase